MSDWKSDMLSEYMLMDGRIAEAERSLKELRARKAAMEKTMRKAARSMGDRRFKVAYYHIAKGWSLSECAKKFGYTKNGVCKIVRCYRDNINKTGN